MYLCVLSSIPDDPNDTPYDPSAHMTGLKWKHHPMHHKGVEKQIRELVNEGVDVFINLVDGTPDDPLSGIGLVQMMEKLGVAFTGADSKFFDPSRQEMKSYAAWFIRRQTPEHSAGQSFKDGGRRSNPSGGTIDPVSQETFSRLPQKRGGGI